MNSTRKDSKPQPKVSVIIPSYNTAKYIGETLESVLAQSYTDYEVIVVNDGSPDTLQLEETLEPYSDRVRYLVQENRGPGGARNHGIREASGQYVAFLDSDDTWAPDFLSKQMGLLEQDAALDLVYADARFVGESPFAGRTFMSVSPSNGEVSFGSLLRQECVVITSCVVARRQALIDAGLFDPKYYHSEDFDLWLRLAHGGAKIGYQRRVLASHRVHGGSLTAQPGMLQRSAISVCDKLLDLLSLSTSDREMLERSREWFAAHLALEVGKGNLQARRTREAAREFASASRVLGGYKLHLILLGLRIAPRLVARAYAYYPLS